jgi:hypothetical protein
MSKTFRGVDRKAARKAELAKRHEERMERHEVNAQTQNGNEALLGWKDWAERMSNGRTQ